MEEIAGDKSSASTVAQQGFKASKPRKTCSKLSVFPSDQHILAMRKKLPVFEPHDLQLLLDEARADSTGGALHALLSAFRRRNDIQSNDLLKSLGIDPSRSDAQSRGFFLLANIFCGVGRLAWHPRRTNRNSATWTLNDNIALLREVTILRGRGLSLRAAVKELAADKKSGTCFPTVRSGMSLRPVSNKNVKLPYGYICTN